MTLARLSPVLRQAFLRPRFGLAARAVGREIRDVPAGDEVAQRGHARVLGELPQRVDRQQIGGLERDLDALVLVRRAARR